MEHFNFLDDENGVTTEVTTKATTKMRTRKKFRQFPWRDIFNRATAPKVKKPKGNNILIGRALNPDYTFWIRLRTGDRTAYDALSLTARHTVESMLPIFVKKLNDTEIGTWTFEPPADWQRFVKVCEFHPVPSNVFRVLIIIQLSENPFQLFETWIHIDDLADHLSSYPDLNYPNSDQVEAARELVEPPPPEDRKDRKLTAKAAENIKLKKEMEEKATKGSSLHPNAELVWTRLSSLSIQRPFMAHKRIMSQNAAMGNVSANSVIICASD